MQSSNQNASVLGVQEYATELGAYDEMYALAGKVQPHWSDFFTALEKMGADELKRKQREAERLMRENGVTYNVYGDDRNLSRPWRLDPVPMLINEKEWLTIERGLQQRAKLLNLILKDIYHEQKLIKAGLVPMELIYGHQGFIRSCMDAMSQLPQSLILYSADLARGPNGKMWVLGDRTQAPSGSGYALENRTVMTRVLPDFFRDLQVKRLAGFFRILHQGLCRLAPLKENPHIVILTPGPLNETYFEHAYLSSYTGYTLVQGDDLTVRDGRVWLKSLDGLQAVDVILRRLDDSYCDPLELFSHSKLGVAGLLEAVRRGNVSIANPLGSSVLENPGLLAFLPGLARHFLGEELILPSIATWWCGQAKERDFVLKNIDKLVIKSINRQFNKHLILGSELSTKERDLLKQQITAKPHLFVGQEQIRFSTVPSLIDGHIEPRNAVMRHFLVAQQEADYQVMPGGLTQVARDKGTFVVSSQAGGISKDTWVLSNKPEKHLSLWPQAGQRKKIEASSDSLSSRVADNLFWVGRNIERVEITARLLRVVLIKHKQTQEFNDNDDIRCLGGLLQILTQVSATYPGFLTNDQALLLSPQQELFAIATQYQRTGSLAASIQNFVQAAVSVRDIWSHDTWRSIDKIQRLWQQYTQAQNDDLDFMLDHLDNLIEAIVSFTGYSNESMSRETAWLLLDGGRRLERAFELNILIQSALTSYQEDTVLNQVLESVLTALDCLSLYKRRYRSYVECSLVLELLILDETHPRSVQYQLKKLYDHISALPREQRKGKLSEAERESFQAYTDLRLTSIEDIAGSSNEALNNNALIQLLMNTNQLLLQISKTVTQTYFSHAQKQELLSTAPRLDKS